MIILGIDPGSARVGYGLVEKAGGRLIYLESGLLETSSSVKRKSLNAVEESFGHLLKKFRPEVVGLEKLFFVKNQKTALEVAQTRGVIVNAVEKASLNLIEVGPSEIKLAITGDGRASKAAVAKMVGFLIKLPPR